MFSKIMELTEKADQRSAEVTLQLVQAIGKWCKILKGNLRVDLRTLASHVFT